MPMKNLQKQGRNLIKDIVISFVNLFIDEHVQDNIMSPLKTLPHAVTKTFELFSLAQFGETDLFAELSLEFGALFAKSAKTSPVKFANYLLILKTVAAGLSKKSLLFTNVLDTVRNIHSELLTDVKNSIKPLLNDQAIEGIYAVLPLYTQYTSGILRAAALPSKKEDTVTEQTIFESFASNNTQEEAFEVIKSLITNLIANIKHINSLPTVEKLTASLSSIYFDWATLTPNTRFAMILTDLTSHVKLLNQLDPKVLLHLQLVLHFALPEASANFFAAAGKDKGKVIGKKYIEERVGR